LVVARGEYSDPFELIERKAPNGVFITVEMAEHVDGYLTAIRERGEYITGGMEVDTSHGSEFLYQINGRADFSAFGADSVLYVDDFKYGWRLVEPEGNWTLISHAIGMVKRTGNVPSEVVLTIFQPRPYHYAGRMREWRISYQHLQQLWNELHSQLCNLSDTVITGFHCYKCHALATCPAARRADMNAIDATDTAIEADMPNEEISFHLDNIYRARKQLEATEEALEEIAKHRLRNGQKIENYAIEPGLGNRRWRENTSAEIIKALTGVDVSKTGLITPAQAEKNGVPPDILAAFVERPQTGFKLIRENEKKRAERLLGKPTNGNPKKGA
jgi:hypothetical protein